MYAPTIVTYMINFLGLRYKKNKTNRNAAASSLTNKNFLRGIKVMLQMFVVFLKSFVFIAKSFFIFPFLVVVNT